MKVLYTSFFFQLISDNHFLPSSRRYHYSSTLHYLPYLVQPFIIKGKSAVAITGKGYNMIFIKELRALNGAVHYGKLLYFAFSLHT